MKVGLIGCGTISTAYLTAAEKFADLEFIACADRAPAAAELRGREFGIPAMSVKELLAHPDVQVVLNLTIPAAHAEINLAAIEHGKHAYCEKPFALDPAAGRRVLERANARGLRVGCAPDTFLGGGLQTCRALIDSGVIGEPVAATAFMMNHGPEGWHPNPEFYYQPGGGPLYDMGPYYLTALVQLLGPVVSVSAAQSRAFTQRTIGSEGAQAGAGEAFGVAVDTHVAALLRFANGAIGSVIMSFDVWHHSNRFIELHGTLGSMSTPDPNRFGGTVRLCTGAAREWTSVPLTHPHTDNMRSIGLADMCAAIEQHRPHRASGELALHVLDIMAACDQAARSGRQISLAPPATDVRAAPLPANGALNIE